MSGTTPVDGNPPPVNFSTTDRLCLDGVRLLLTAGSSYWALGSSQYSPENDPYTKVAYTNAGSFSVKRKDGTTTLFGDTTISSQSRPTVTLSSGSATVQWNLSRIQDAVGNYIDYLYINQPSTQAFATGSVENQLQAVKYTGHLAAPATATYATVTFSYEDLPSMAQMRKGYQAGAAFVSTQRLKSITVSDTTASAPTVRYYEAAYATSVSGSGGQVLSSVTECRDSNKLVCFAPTQFTWSAAVNQFAAGLTTTQSGPDFVNLVGYKVSDVDGDGRADIVWAKNNDSGCTASSRLYVSYTDLDANGKMILITPAQAAICAPGNLLDNEMSWYLTDYDGDGRADLFIGGKNGAAWKVYASTGRPTSSAVRTFSATDSLAGLATPITSPTTMEAAGLLADLNGDGLADFLYATGSGAGGAATVKARLMVRSAIDGTLGFSNPYEINYAYNDESICDALNGIECAVLFFYNNSQRNSTILSDVNADGRADITLKMRWTQDTCTSACPRPSGTVYTDGYDGEKETRAIIRKNYWFQFTVSQITNGATPAIHFDEYWRGLIDDPATSTKYPLDSKSMFIVDLNGDGLSDILYRDAATPSSNLMIAMLNKGSKAGGSYGSAFSTTIANPEQLQLFDANGDGLTDLVYPALAAAIYKYVYVLPDATFSASTASSAPFVGGVGLFGGSVMNEWVSLVGDFDADGANDFVRLKVTGSSNNIYISRAPDGSRYKPRDMITGITNGLGANTALIYQPLTNKGIYQRGLAKGIRAFALNYGWNSPVFDLLAPMYVVTQATSSAPRFGSPMATSTVHYRYEAGLMQAGGRGFLGFETVWSFDTNDTPASGQKYTASATTRSQNYPFVGLPFLTQTLAFSGGFTRGSAELDVCANNPESTIYSCFSKVTDSGAAPVPTVVGWPNLVQSGTIVRYSGNQSRCQGAGCETPPESQCTSTTADSTFLRDTSFGIASLTDGLFVPPATASPVFTSTHHDLDIQGDLDGGTGTAGIQILLTNKNSYCYDSYGNVKYGRTTTYDAGGVLLAQKHVANTYSTVAGWAAMGRLTQSQVTFRRVADEAPHGALPDIVRTTDFDYYPTTLLLKSERLQKGLGGDQDLRTVYTYDNFGNKTGAYQCDVSRGVTDDDCLIISALKQRPLDGGGHSGTIVHRYAKTTYDIARGRYVASSSQPFYSASATNNVNEQTALTINSRDEFGNPTQQTSANGLIQYAVAGSLGRPYFTSDNTGRAATTTYRRCIDAGTNGCPTDAVFRSQTISVGAPSGWTYFDVLGRPIVAITQSLDTNAASSKFSAVCSYYDAHARSALQTEPFFAPATEQVDGSPTFTSTTPCVGRAATATSYDVLGRVTQVTQPNSATVVRSYAGLTTFTRNQRNFIWEETRNALGEVIESRDPTDAADLNVGLIVRTYHDATGNVLSIVRDAGHGDIVTSMTYDALGRKRQMVDPDAGTSNYSYNAAGEVISQTDAKNQTTYFDFDAMGRNWRKIAAGSDGNTITDTWTFDTASNGLGVPFSEARQATVGMTFSRSMSYDTYGRLSQRNTSIAGTSYVETTAYDGYGRVRAQQDATGDTLTNVYSAFGHLKSLSDSRNGTIYEVLSQTARGQVAQDKRGDSTSLQSTMTYDPQTGRLNTVCSGTSSCNLQDLRYQFDTAGNLVERERSRSFQPTTEAFTHDALNRLTYSRLTKIGGAVQVVPLQTALISYDKLGNICSKNGDVYSYSGRAGCANWGTTGSPHALSMLSSNQDDYIYDANGSLLEIASNSTFGYDANNQLVSIYNNKGIHEEFQYTPSGDRFVQLDGVTNYVFYVGNVEFVRNAGVISETRRYLRGIAIQLQIGKAAPQLRYTFTDHLGSLDAVANASGALIEAASFSVHGERRNPTSWQVTSTTPTPSTTPRGFTGHEHLDAFNIIHMNGRTYDPLTGRMMQADPLSDGTAQGLNRYSYVANNPLALTDPTGYMSVTDIVRAAVAIVITVYSGGTAAGAAWGFWGAAVTANQAFAAIVIGGFAAGTVQTGTVKGGLYGAFSAAVFYGVGSAFRNYGTPGNFAGSNLSAGGYTAKVLAHGVTGGVMSSLQGGKFGHGFASAGVTQAFSGAIDNIGDSTQGAARRVMAAALVGGTASVVGGGKFGNGAVTAAFSRAFNDEADRRERMQESIKVKGYIRGIIGFEYDGESITGSIATKFPFHMELDENGQLTLTQGSTIVKVNGMDGSLGSGIRWKSLSLDVVVLPDQKIDFTGEIGLPATFPGGLFGDFSISYTRRISVDPTMNSGGIGVVARAIRDRQQVIDCASGYSTNCGK